MNLNRLARRDELAREHQLGRLELQCTPMTFKVWTILIVVAVGLVLAVATRNLTLVVLSLPASLVMASIIYLLNDRAVYLYTRGLVFLGGIRKRVVLWGDIREVKVETWAGRYGPDSRLAIYLKDGTTMSTPATSTTSQGSASPSMLENFIEGKMRPND